MSLRQATEPIDRFWTSLLERVCRSFPAGITLLDATLPAPPPQN